MKRPIALIVVASTMLLTPVATGSAQAQVPGPNGQIAFARQDPTICSDCTSTFTVNPDGSHQLGLFPNSDIPHWSPDGTQVAVLHDCVAHCGAVIVNPDTGSSREVLETEQEIATFNVNFACVVWSPDATRLACEADGDTPGVTGIYTIRSSDGGDLTRITAAPAGGADVPGDYSPDGKGLVFTRFDASGQPELFVVRLSGGGLRQITPAGTSVDGEDGDASWSPSGNQILFGGKPDADHRRAIFVVASDGRGLHQVPISGCGGALSDPRSIACFDPRWSPDGTKIAFARARAMFGVQAIYTANADGSGLSQVTTGSNLGVFFPDWGPHPLAT